MQKMYNSVIILVSLLLIQSAAFTQKNYISIEAGSFYGGPSTNIANSFKQYGFGDTKYWLVDLFFFSFSGESKYPQTSGGNLAWRIRYVRELKNNHTIEVNFGQIHNSEVDGFDIAGTGNRHINFNNKVSLLSSSYMLNNKKHSLGIGAGPALAFYKLDISGYTEDTNKDTYSMNNSYLQPGITVAAYWRFINKKIFFMDLRSDLTFLAPAKTNEISNNEGAVIFPSIKVNHSFFDVTMGAGIKF
ncbi:hypothetical protein BH10BAC2_BH10BAC2_47340 [soil metagenome]